MAKGKLFIEVKAGDTLYYVAGISPIQYMLIKEISLYSTQQRKITYFFCPYDALRGLMEDVVVNAETIAKLPTRHILVPLDKSLLITMNSEPLIICTTEEELTTFINAN